MAAGNLTKPQRRMLKFYADFIRKNFIAPTLRDVAAALGFKTPSAVMCHVVALERKGKLRRIGGVKARALIPVVEKGTCLVCGHKTAGKAKR